jgi:hypothetical protein
MLRATGTGIYHLSHLSSSFTYIDAIIIDVTIFDKETREKISNTFDIKERLERATVFASYLDNIWDSENFKNTHFIWKQKSQELRADIKRIIERVK